MPVRLYQHHHLYHPSPSRRRRAWAPRRTPSPPRSPPKRKSPTRRSHTPRGRPRRRYRTILPPALHNLNWNSNLSFWRISCIVLTPENNQVYLRGLNWYHIHNCYNSKNNKLTICQKERKGLLQFKSSKDRIIGFQNWGYVWLIMD